MGIYSVHRLLLMLILVVALSILESVNALGCMSTICSADPDARHPVNKIIRCASDGHCGHYRALRRNNQFVEAVDLSCHEHSAVYAPFDGELSPWRPFNGNGEGEMSPPAEERAKCKPDQGVRIDGIGQWQGYHVLIASVRLFRYSGRVRAGQKIGKAMDLECADRRQQRAKKDENFVRVHLFREGRPIDATHHLIDCMCTGQICETNRVNAFEGPSFKFDSRYNGVRGWELKCPDVQPPEATSDESLELADGDEQAADRDRTVPQIYSPIEGEAVGRIRVSSEPGAQSYSGCTNEGIFIVGTGKWTDYEVRIFNARFRESLGLGRQHIEQGQHIGSRLECPGEDVPPTVFMEVRFQGTLLDISDAITAKSCKHKQLRNIIERFRI